MVELEPMAEHHVDRTYAWLANSAELRAQIDSLDEPTPEGNRTYWQRNLADASRADFAIVDGGRHIGNCGLTHIDRRRGKAELWIYLGEGRGAGQGGKALKLLLDQAFGTLGLRRVHLRVVETNKRVVEFYRRAGFQIEGRARADTIHAGSTVDAVLMSILAHEHRR